MPRFYTIGQKPIDLCRECWESSPQSLQILAKKTGNWDVEHPPYEETEYTCEWCNKRLTSSDE